MRRRGLAKVGKPKERLWRGENIRLVLRPTAVPRVMGTRIEAGRLRKTESGRVKFGR